MVCTGDHEQGGCNPTDFGLPCSSDADCFKELKCLEAGPDPRSLHDYSPRLCTQECTNDDDCDANRLIKGRGFCEEGAGICRRSGKPGMPCDRPKQCDYKACSEQNTCSLPR